MIVRWTVLCFRHRHMLLLGACDAQIVAPISHHMRHVLICASILDKHRCGQLFSHWCEAFSVFVLCPPSLQVGAYWHCLSFELASTVAARAAARPKP